ncbi:MAG: hypothetical protein KAI02_02420 [Gammaproteobacteria bacterium]|nr:hypothetical protein [Gammaproteobacteria bacterium]
MEKFHGKLIGILRWHQLDELWQTILLDSTNEWYIYHIGDTPPTNTCPSDKVQHFIKELDKLLKHDHDHDYCGIVYTDSKTSPTFIKIYDPNNLGQVCGSSNLPPPLPGWILSKTIPIDLHAEFAPVGNRKRWWQQIFS